MSRETNNHLMSSVDDIRSKLGSKEDSYQLFLTCVKNGEYDRVTWFVERGLIDINASDKNSMTALHHAVLSNKPEIVALLLPIDGIDINKHANGDVDTDSKYDDDMDDADDIDLGIRLNYTPLHYAAKYGLTDIAKQLLDRPEIRVNAEDDHGITPLILAVEHGHMEVTEQLLNRDDVNVNIISSYEQINPLLLATSKGNTQIVRRLVAKRGIDVNVKGQNGRTALHIAAKEGHTEIVDLLLTTPGIEVDVNAKSGDAKSLESATPLFLAVLGNQTETVKRFLVAPGIDVNSNSTINRTSSSSMTALELAMYACERHEILKLLFAHRDIHVEDVVRAFIDGRIRYIGEPLLDKRFVVILEALVASMDDFTLDKNLKNAPEEKLQLALEFADLATQKYNLCAFSYLYEFLISKEFYNEALIAWLKTPEIAKHFKIGKDLQEGIQAAILKSRSDMSAIANDSNSSQYFEDSNAPSNPSRCSLSAAVSYFGNDHNMKRDIVEEDNDGQPAKNNPHIARPIG